MFFIIKVEANKYKMKLMFGALLCLSVMATEVSAVTENSNSGLDDLSEWEGDYREVSRGLENDNGNTEQTEGEKNIADLARLVSEEMKRNEVVEAGVDAKRQDGKAGLWGKRRIQQNTQDDSDVEIMRRTVMKMALLNAKALSESKREQHGSTGLWGKRSKKEHGSLDQSSLKKRMIGLKQPEDTGLWGRRRSTKKLYRPSQDPRKQNGQSNQPDTIGLWGGKRGIKDTTRGPSDKEKVGLWGKRQHGKAGLWGRRRSLVKIF